MPDSDAAPGEHSKAVVEPHAHVKSADRYLEKARRRASVPLPEDGDDGDAAARPRGALDPAGDVRDGSGRSRRQRKH
jgi:hypothetical protein